MVESRLLNQTLTEINARRKKHGQNAINEFKPKQKECILASMKNADLLGILPTGYGKSLLFEAIPMYRAVRDRSAQKRTIIISPLNAIITQQIKTLAPDSLKMYSNTTGMFHGLIHVLL